jgi:F-type H+-transporting ATPase subunit gamma
MTERLAEIEERIDSVGQLSSVVTAIRGIAAARLREAEERLEGIRTYAGTIAEAIGHALALIADSDGAAPAEALPGGHLVIALCSEQGFAGAFNAHVLVAAERLVGAGGTELFVVGDRGLMIAGEHDLAPGWSIPMAAHIDEVTGLANRLAEALYRKIDEGVTGVTIVHASPDQAEAQPVVEKALIPFDFSRFPPVSLDIPPLLTLPPAMLLAQLAEEYVFAELCEAVMLSYAAENQARMRAMLSAQGNVEKRLNELTASARRMRQEEITSEVVELAAGVEAGNRGGL